MEILAAPRFIRYVVWLAAAIVSDVVAFGWTPFAAFIDHAPKIMSGEAFPAFRNPLAVSNNGSVPGLVLKLRLLGVPHRLLLAIGFGPWRHPSPLEHGMDHNADGACIRATGWSVRAVCGGGTTTP